MLKKAKNHVGNMNNYSFDRQGFLTYMKKLPSGSTVIWRYLAIKFHVKNKSGQFPKNAGQVLMTFATQNGIDTDQFNECGRVSGRDFFSKNAKIQTKNLQKHINSDPKTS